MTSFWHRAHVQHTWSILAVGRVLVNNHMSRPTDRVSCLCPGSVEIHTSKHVDL